MAVLASPEDVEASLGRSLDSSEEARCSTLLQLASAHVADYTGVRFAPGSYTVGRRVRAGKVRLPGRAATVDEVRDIDEATGGASALAAGTDYTSRGRTIYGLGCRYVEVDFTITADVPEDVISVVAGIAASTLSGPPVGVGSEQAGTVQVSYVNSTGKVWLSASDRAILNRYRQPRPSLDIVAAAP